ncbi:hypothetical protein GLE_1833 [Lysobacter enzymogenes]|uniref:Uncharacterized protein n=1 Tax=Lysobacter enzymogenes TaxID=69 RepID=A0A0S2DF86_LYSEN|nr:hypothetical protein GLE_1833 [Lysobacter enzymogenes]
MQAHGRKAWVRVHSSGRARCAGRRGEHFPAAARTCAGRAAPRAAAGICAVPARSGAARAPGERDAAPPGAPRGGA